MEDIVIAELGDNEAGIGILIVVLTALAIRLWKSRLRRFFCSNNINKKENKNL